MTIAGTGFGSTAENVQVYISNSTGKIYRMRVISVTNTQIRCGIPGGLPGNYVIQVAIAGVGIIPASPSTAT